jgi:hypothetical protein
MKKYLTLTVVLAAALALGLTANAYIPTFSVYECPHCKTHVIKEGWASEFRGTSSIYPPNILSCSGQITTIKGGSYSGGRRHKWSYYTDGKSGSGNPAWIAKCPVCGNLFWMDKFNYVGSGDNGQKRVLGPSEKELFVFLSVKTLDKERELLVRQQAWWTANDAWRHSQGKTNFSEAQVNNLQTLSEMLDESQEIERIFKAEIARELGDFEKCLKLLSHPFDEKLQRLSGFIRKRALEGDRDVWPLM